MTYFIIIRINFRIGYHLKVPRKIYGTARAGSLIVKQCIDGLQADKFNTHTKAPSAMVNLLAPACQPLNCYEQLSSAYFHKLQAANDRTPQFASFDESYQCFSRWSITSIHLNSSLLVIHNLRGPYAIDRATH